MGVEKSQLIIFFLLLASLKSLGSTLPSEYSIVGNGLHEVFSEESIIELFQRWKEKHQKVYKHEKEYEIRLENFKRNLKYIIEKSRTKKAVGSGHEVGLNKFADMTNEEFRQKYLAKVKKPINKKSILGSSSGLQRNLHSCDAPSSLDWREDGVVTGVKDQGECGSCWAFSTTGAIEGVNAINSGDLVSLSEQELIDCDSTNEGCDGGYMDYAFEWVISNGGIDTESDYPYTSYYGVDGTCNSTKEETKAVSIEGYEDVAESDSALLCATVQQPVSVGMDGSAWDFQLYTGGIYDGDCSDNPDDIDHAVLIVGYGSEGSEDYWIVKNSWGTSWGLEGYFYLRRNTSLTYGVCAVNAMASYPTQTSSPSPTSPPPPPPPPSPITPPPPPPPPSPPPPPPPPITPPPPPPPSPSPNICGDDSYCPADETCCCIFEIFDICLLYGCCSYENAVCCTGTEYCCPSDYPICDVQQGLCLQGRGDSFGILAKKRHIARLKFPWNKLEGREKTSQQLQWRRNPFAAVL